MVYVDNASAQIPWLPCLLVMTVGDEVATAADAEYEQSSCMCGHFSALHEVKPNTQLIQCCVCVCVFSRGVGTGCRDALRVLPVFVSQSFITSTLCASQRSDVTIFEQLHTIVMFALLHRQRGQRSGLIRWSVRIFLESWAEGNREQHDIVWYWCWSSLSLLLYIVHG